MPIRKKEQDDSDGIVFVPSNEQLRNRLMRWFTRDLEERSNKPLHESPTISVDSATAETSNQQIFVKDQSDFPREGCAIIEQDDSSNSSSQKFRKVSIPIYYKKISVPIVHVPK